MEPRARLADDSRESALGNEVRRSMSDPESNSNVPEGELLAALAEIEKMSGEEAAAIPSRDEHGPKADDAAGSPPTPESQRPAPNAGNTLAPGSDDVSYDEAEISAALDRLETLTAEVQAPSANTGASEATATAEDATSTASQAAGAGATAEAGGTSSSSELLGDEQLQAALAEVETISSNPQATSGRHTVALDDGRGEARADEPAGKPVAAEPPGDDEPEAEVPTTPAQPKLKKLRFKIGTKSADEDAADYQPPDERGEADATAGAVQPIAPLAKRIYRAIDRGLDTINRPFAGLDDPKRALVGWAALTTLIVSILAIALMPKILPHRDAITFLLEKRAQLGAPPAAETPDSPEVDD